MEPLLPGAHHPGFLLTPLLQIPLPGQAAESSTVLSYTTRIVNIRETVIPANPGISSGMVLNTLYIVVIALAADTNNDQSFPD